MSKRGVKRLPVKAKMDDFVRKYVLPNTLPLMNYTRLHTGASVHIVDPFYEVDVATLARHNMRECAKHYVMHWKTRNHTLYNLYESNRAAVLDSTLAYLTLLKSREVELKDAFCDDKNGVSQPCGHGLYATCEKAANKPFVSISSSFVKRKHDKRSGWTSVEMPKVDDESPLSRAHEGLLLGPMSFINMSCKRHENVRVECSFDGTNKLFTVISKRIIGKYEQLLWCYCNGSCVDECPFGECYCPICNNVCCGSA
jgi:hypothetical protein